MIKSSLTGRKVVTGMGSAHIQNQQMAGSKNPEHSANIASEKYTEDELLDLQSKKAEIEKETENGFEPKAPLDLDNVNEIYNDLESWRSSKIDEELEDEYYPSITPDDPLYNPMTDLKRKKAVEATLEPIAFDDMIFKGYADQTIEIRKGFTVTFRTLTTQHSLWIEQKINTLSQESMAYGKHYLSLQQVACSLQSINGRPIGRSLSAYNKMSHKEEFDKALKEKFEALSNMPHVITDDLIVHYTWFSGRVRKLLAGDVGRKVGNS